MSDLLDMLLGGDLRSEGRAAEVAQQVADAPSRVDELASGLEADDRLLRARTCMALEVLSRKHAGLVAPLASQLATAAAAETVAPARWHLAEVFANIELPEDEVDGVVATLLRYLDDESRIVVHTAVLGLGRHAPASGLRPEVRARLEALDGGSKGFQRAVTDARARLTADG